MGARLLPIICGIRISRIMGKRFYFLWNKSYLDFENLGELELIFKKEFIEKSYLERIPSGEFINWKDFSKDCDRSSNFIISDPFNLSIMPEDNKLSISHELMSIIFEILNPNITLKFHALLQELSIRTRSVTALHIRRGDLMTIGVDGLRDIYERYMPTEFYDCLIEQRLLLNSNDKFIIFSDDKEHKDYLTKKYSDNVTVIDSKKWSFEVTRLEEDMLDLLLMTTCGEIINSKSAYSNLASIIGNSFKRNIMECLEPNKSLKILKTIVEENHGREKSFIIIKIIKLNGCNELTKEKITEFFNDIYVENSLLFEIMLKNILPRTIYTQDCFEVAIEYSKKIESEYDRKYIQGILFKWQGDLEKAIDTSISLLEIVDKIEYKGRHNLSNRYGLMNHIGNLLYYFGDYKKSMQYHKMAMVKESGVNASAARMYSNASKRIN